MRGVLAGLGGILRRLRVRIVAWRYNNKYAVAAYDNLVMTPSPQVSPSLSEKFSGREFCIALDGSPIRGGSSGERMVVKTVDAGLGKKVLKLSGGNPDALAAGRTGGYSVPVPRATEVAASGARVRVSVLARAAKGQAEAEFLLAYSTNEVGNSGWRKFAVGPDFDRRGFEWDVPVMIKGFGDYVGILPAEPGGAGVEFCEVKVEVVGRG